MTVVVCSADDVKLPPKKSGGPTPAPAPPVSKSDPPAETDSDSEPKPSSGRPAPVSHPPILPPHLPPPPNNCSGICNKIYAPVCGGPVYGCGELVQQGNVCEFNYFNCVNLIKTGVRKCMHKPFIQTGKY